MNRSLLAALVVTGALAAAAPAVHADVGHVPSPAPAPVARIVTGTYDLVVTDVLIDTCKLFDKGDEFEAEAVARPGGRLTIEIEGRVHRGTWFDGVFRADDIEVFEAPHIPELPPHQRPVEEVDFQGIVGRFFRPGVGTFSLQRIITGDFPGGQCLSVVQGSIFLQRDNYDDDKPED